MSIILPVAELKPALAGLGKIISKRNTLPVLGHVKIERTQDGWIALTGTNLDSFATVRLEQPSEGTPGSFLVSLEDLNRTVKACGKSESIELDTTGEKSGVLRYSIGSQQVETPIHTLPADEFPELPKMKTEAVAVPDSLRESLHQAFACASTDETRYVITGALIDVSEKNCHKVIGTNGRQLYTSNSFSLPLEKSVLIRPAKFLQWKEFNADGTWQLKVTHPRKDDSGWLQLSSRRWRFITRQMEGNFPNYRQVLLDPTKFNTTVELDPEGIANIVTMMGQMPCHDPINQTIGIEVKNGDVTLLGRAPNAEQWTRLGIQARVKGANITTYLNREFFAQALKFGLNTIELVDGMSPLRLSNGGRQVIIMPIRVDGPPRTAITQAPAPQPEPTIDPAQNEQVSETQTQNRKEAMNTPTDTPDITSTDKIEESLELIESLKVSFQDTLTSLKDLGAKLKQIQRDRKTSEREMQGIRNSIRSLQTIRV